MARRMTQGRRGRGLSFLRDGPRELDRAVVDARHLAGGDADLVMAPQGGDPYHPVEDRHESSALTAGRVKFRSTHGANRRGCLQSEAIITFQFMDFGKDAADFQMGYRFIGL